MLSARGAALALITGAICVLAPVSPAMAAGGVDCQTDAHGNCIITVTNPGSGGGTNGGTDGGTPKDTGSQGPACVSDGSTGFDKGPIPCSDPHMGGWSNTYQCYIQLADPQPPAGDPAWRGHDTDEGAVYACWMVVPFGGLVPGPLWLANPPAGVGGGPSPYEVAQMAIAKMNFKAGQIGIVPEPGPNKLGIVGMPTWMWVADPGPSTTGPITASASAGPITVSATAELDRIEWDMGDGSKVTCAGSRAKGTPYSDGYGRQDSPTCGHRYERTSGSQPDNAYTVTANSYWAVNWSGAGQSGTITLPALTRSVQIRVGELQVLQQR